MTTRASGKSGNKTGIQKCVQCFGRNGAIAQIKSRRLIARGMRLLRRGGKEKRNKYPLYYCGFREDAPNWHARTHPASLQKFARLLFLFIVLRRNHSWRCPDSNSDSLQEFPRISGFIARDDRREIIVLPLRVQRNN